MAFACDAKGLGPDLLHRHAVGKGADLLQDDPLASRKRCVQGRRVLWLDTDDECLGPQTP